MNVPGGLADVDWSGADSDPTCWKYHIPPTVRGNWNHMGTEAKTTAAYMAEQAAKREQQKSIVTKGPLAGGLSRRGWSE